MVGCHLALGPGREYLSGQYNRNKTVSKSTTKFFECQSQRCIVHSLSIMEHSHLAMMVARSCGSNVAKAHGAMVHVGLGSLGLGAHDLKPEFLGPGV